MANKLPTKAKVVVVGGGVIGCSVAYHLTKLGWSDVLLVVVLVVVVVVVVRVVVVIAVPGPPGLLADVVPRVDAARARALLRGGAVEDHVAGAYGPRDARRGRTPGRPSQATSRIWSSRRTTASKWPAHACAVARPRFRRPPPHVGARARPKESMGCPIRDFGRGGAPTR